MEEKHMDITQLRPTIAKFKLNLFGDYEFKLKPCTGGMIIDMSEMYGPVDAMLYYPTVANVSKLAMYLFDYDSSAKFKKQSVKYINVENGEEETKEIGGYKLLAHSIQGVNEQMEVYKAILTSMGYKKEDTEKMAKQFIDNINGVVEENLNNVKKKMNQKQSVGEKY